jgi:hypothetical protein
MLSLRRGAGAAEQAGLENRSGGNSTVGSNPTLSAIYRHQLFVLNLFAIEEPRCLKAEPIAVCRPFESCGREVKPDPPTGNELAPKCHYRPWRRAGHFAVAEKTISKASSKTGGPNAFAILGDQGREFFGEVPVEGMAELSLQIFVKNNAIDLVEQAIHILQVHEIPKRNLWSKAGSSPTGDSPDLTNPMATCCRWMR